MYNQWISTIMQFQINTRALTYVWYLKAYCEHCVSNLEGILRSEAASDVNTHTSTWAANVLYRCVWSGSQDCTLFLLDKTHRQNDEIIVTHTWSNSAPKHHRNEMYIFCYFTSNAVMPLKDLWCYHRNLSAISSLSLWRFRNHEVNLWNKIFPCCPTAFQVVNKDFQWKLVLSKEQQLKLTWWQSRD